MKPDLQEIVSTTIRLHSKEMVKALDLNAVLREFIKNMPPPKPLTRMERLQQRLQDAKDALRVLRGEASYIEWYDE